ncbi:MAG: Ig-like domain repeat protein [Burkholderiales bacterium]|nr:Ig-like domain repeat protein [Burkholderiales bacterium]
MRILLFLLALTAAQGQAATFTVTSTADTAGSSCGATCTLRQALLAASSNPGNDTVAFNIPGAGPHRIVTGSSLPAASGVLIDGYSQPGALANTDPLASHAVLKIIVDFSGLPAGNVGINISGGSTLRGVALIATANNVGVDVGTASVSGCWFNVEPDGVTTAALGAALRLATGQTSTVGGPAVADRNVFAATAAATSSIIANAGGTHVIQGNLFGLLPDGQTPGALGQAISGSAISSGQQLVDNTIACTANAIAVQNYGSVITGNRFGTTVSGANPGCTTGRLSSASGQRFTGNTFAYLNSTPVSVASNLSGVVFRGNRVVDVAAVPFDLNANGVTLNDPDDNDTGANGLQNYPVITSARIVDANQLELSGTLDSAPNTSYALDFYASDEVSRAAFNFFAFADGERVATTSVTVTTDANGVASFGPVTLSFDGSGVMGVVSGTATRLDAGSNPVETSEYGEARATYTAGSGDLVVSNTNAGGPGSLLRALLEAESRPDGAGRDRITFNIPGPGPHTLGIAPLSQMIIAGRVEIDGMTQPGAVANTTPGAIDAQLKIDINGAKLFFSNADVLIRGVVMRGPSALLSLTGGGAVEGSFIGVSADGLSLASTADNTAQINCSGCRIGGPALAQRNLIGCPQIAAMSCISIQGAGAQVEGNLIGVNRTGLSRLLTPTDSGGSQTFTAINVEAAGAQIRGNTIGGFARGMRLLFNNHQIENNRVGVGVDDATSLANARNGVEIFGSGIILRGNHIANQTRDGVLVRNGSTLATVIENRIRSNGELALDLDVSNTTHGDGVSANDPLDADSGPNNGQNFPVLSQVRREAAGIVANVSLSSTPNQSFRLRYCYVVAADSSGHGECDQPIVGVTHSVTTDASGNFSGTTPTLPATALNFLTVTAATVSGSFVNTSEFAQSVRIADLTATTITAHTPDPSFFGQPVTVTVSVASQAGTPAGTVNIASSNGGNCTATLSSGSGSCALTPAAAGAITLTATFPGSAEFFTSGDSESHTVAPAITATTITSDTPDPSTFGDAITVSFQVQSTPTASGTVTVSNGVVQCQGTLDAGGLGSCVLTPGTGGAIVLTASYPGTGNFAASSDTEAHTVNAVASTLAILAHTPNPSVSGQPVNVAAQLSSTVGTPAGPIVISDGAGAACEIAGASGNCNLIPINAGAVTLRADFAASATHLASTASAAHQVDRAATALTAGTPSDTAGNTPRQFALMRFPVAIDVNAPGAGAPTGTITVTGTPGVEVCVIALPATQCELVVQTPGSRSFDIQYAGDSRYLPVSAQINASVLPDAVFANGMEGEE